MDVLDRLIDREGGYVWDPDDRGGPTKYGITQDTLAWARSRPVHPDEVARLTRDEARAIYEQRYWRQPRIAEIPDPALAELVLDTAVLHGTRRAVRWLQTALDVDVDGEIGPVTLAALQRSDPDPVRRAVLRCRLAHVGRLISLDHAQGRFAYGWLRRIAEFV